MSTVQKTYRVYGKNGKEQAASYADSVTIFGTSKDHLRKLEIRNADLTGTHQYSEVEITCNITCNPEGDCIKELNHQICDGFFENVPIGEIKEVWYKDPYKVDQLWKMLKAEINAPEDQQYGAHLQHWSGEAMPINIDAGALRALIAYYSTEH